MSDQDSNFVSIGYSVNFFSTFLHLTMTACKQTAKSIMMNLLSGMSGCGLCKFEEKYEWNNVKQ